MFRMITANHNLTHAPRDMRYGSAARQAGFAYVMLLITVMAMGVGLAAIGDVWHTTNRREKEQELLFVGDQFRLAIAQYYAQTPPGNTQRFPSRLEDLLKDPRLPGTRRYLRKIFTDPISGEKKWGVVRGINGGISGVYSLSVDKPFKKSGFKLADKDFEGMSRYADWVFMPRVGQMAMPPPKTPAP